MNKLKITSYIRYESEKRNFPKSLSPQEYERRIKEIARKAGV